MNKTPSIVIVGPTASGKTELAVALARVFNGEIISADSMQIYRGMDIATAKPTAQERGGIPHHLIDVLPPDAAYSVAAFVADARAAARDIVSRGKTVIVAGGTGLYVDSLIRNTVFEDEGKDGSVRARLNARLLEEGSDALYRELLQADPEYAEQIDPRNTVRLIRALEILQRTGEKPSDRRRRAVIHESDFRPVWIGLDFRDRSLLYGRIEKRVDAMLEAGLLDETQRFIAASPGPTAVQAIGYKELIPCLGGEITLAAARENLIQATRRYAKRQLTWFRRNPDIHWIFRDGADPDFVAAEGERIVRESGVLEEE